MEHRLSFSSSLTALIASDTGWWAVWLGRLTLERVSRVTYGQLKRVRNPPKSLRAKAGLTGFSRLRNPERKRWSSDPQVCSMWLLEVIEKLPRG